MHLSKLKTYWFTAVSVGAVVLLLTLADLSILHWTSVGVTVSAMLIYFASGKGHASSEGITEIFADSIYYMGFIFTLLALTFSVISLGMIGEFEREVLLFRFGLALITTVLGVGLRTFLITFNADSKDAIATAEKQVLKAARTLADEMDRVSISLVSSTETFDQLARNTATEFNKVSTSVSKSGSKYSSAVMASGESIGSSTDTLSKAVEESVSRLSTSLGSAEEHIATQVDTYLKRIADLTLSPDQFKSKIDPAVQELSSSLSDYSEAVNDMRVAMQSHFQKEADFISRLESVTSSTEKAIKSTNEEVDNLALTVSRLEKNFLEVGKRVDEMNNAILDSGTAAEIASSSAKRMAASVKDDMDRISDYRASLHTELEQSKHIISELNRGVLGAVRTLRKELS